MAKNNSQDEVRLNSPSVQGDYDQQNARQSQEEGDD